jgi:hypothetical protein
MVTLPTLKYARKVFKRTRAKPVVDGGDIWVNYAIPPPPPSPELYYRRFFGSQAELRKLVTPFGSKFREFGTGARLSSTAPCGSS